jgi:hypothetical protein
MANITFTLEELLTLLLSNNLLPSQIARAQIKDDCFHFAVKTDAFILPFVPASLKFLSYENNIARFELTLVSGHFNKALSMFGGSFESKLPEYVKLELPNVLVDIEKLLEKKNIKGIHVRDVTFESGEFSITTENI